MYYDKNKVTRHEKRAVELFLSGYNCAQSVFAAFSDVTGIDERASFKIASAFGGGMCGNRLTCGALAGMILTLGTLCGYDEATDHDGKVALYRVGKALSDEFEELLGSKMCAELLAGIKLSATPRVRDEEYYATRPCARFCAVAAHLLDAYLEENA